MAFISFFCSIASYEVEFLDHVILTVFELLPNISYLSYFLSNSMILFPPFSSPRTYPQSVQDSNLVSNDKGSRRRIRNKKQFSKYFTEIPLKNVNAMFSLHVALRSEYVPNFIVRKARIQDCDDLIPIFKQRNV